MKFLSSFEQVFGIIDNILDKIASPIYHWLIILLYIIYLAAFFGILYVNNAYIHHLDVFIQTFIAVILIIRFNPFRKHVLKESDNTLIFASAFFLLMNVGLTTGVDSYMHKIWNNNIKPQFTNHLTSII